MTFSAQAYVNKLIGISGCVIRHNYQNDNYGGEPLASKQGWSDSSDGVLKRWVENEDPFNSPNVFSNSGHLSQALWRGTNYIGCATANKIGYIQLAFAVTLLRVIVISLEMDTVGHNWSVPTPVLVDHNALRRDAFSI